MLTKTKINLPSLPAAGFLSAPSDEELGQPAWLLGLLLIQFGNFCGVFFLPVIISFFNTAR